MSLQTINRNIVPVISNLSVLPPSNQFFVQTNNRSYSEFKFYQIIESIENPIEYQTTLGKIVGGAFDETMNYFERAWEYIFPNKQAKEQDIKHVLDDEDGCTRYNDDFAWSNTESFNCTRPDGSSYSQWYEPVVYIWGNCNEFYSPINDRQLAKKAMYACLSNMVKIYYRNVRQSTSGQACLLELDYHHIVNQLFSNQATFSLYYGDNSDPNYLLVNQSQIPLPSEVNDCYTQNTYQNDTTGTTYKSKPRKLEGVSQVSYRTPYCTFHSIQQTWEVIIPSVDFFKYTSGERCFSYYYLNCMAGLITSYFDNLISPACGTLNPNVTQISIPLHNDGEFNIYSILGFPIYQLEGGFPIQQVEECYVSTTSTCFQRRHTTYITLLSLGISIFSGCTIGGFCLYRICRQPPNPNVEAQELLA